jgi:hypothetical protein
MNSTANDSTTSDSTDELNVLVLATGLVKAEKYVKSYESVAKRVDNALDGLEAMLDAETSIVLTRGSAKLEDTLADELTVDVDEAFFPWPRFLNDTADTDDYGNVIVPAVRQEDEPAVNADADDMSDGIDWDKVTNERVKRAKAKAGAKMNHYLFDEFYDDYPDVDAVITLNCGSHRGLNEIRDARGNNDWVEGQAGHVKQVIDLNVQDQILYSRHMLDSNEEMGVSDLHDSQIDELREALPQDELEDIGIGPNKASTGTPPTPASAD